MSNKATDSDHIPCVMIKKDEPILLESCKNHSAIQTNGICTTLTRNMGYECKYIPMIVQEVRNERETDGLCGGESP